MDYGLPVVKETPSELDALKTLRSFLEFAWQYECLDHFMPAFQKAKVIIDRELLARGLKFVETKRDFEFKAVGK